MNLEELEKLFELKERGVITAKEFEAQKARILEQEISIPKACCGTATDLPKKSPWAWYVGCIKKYVTFSGRATRSEYWYFILVNVLFAIGFSIIDAGIGTTPILSYLYSLFIMLPAVAAMFRRLHDAGFSGWWGGIGMIVFFVVFFIIGYTGASQMGDGSQVSSGFAAFVLLSLLALLVYQIVIWVFLCFKTQPCENKYGPVPQQL